MKDIFRRALRAATFDRKTFVEALWEHSATADAALLVVVVSAFVAVVNAIRFGYGITSMVSGVLSFAIYSLAAWLFLAIATWFVGSRLFTPAGDSRRRFEAAQMMLRMHGLAFLPVALSVFGGFVALAGQLWYLAAAALGTSVALDSKAWEGGIAVLLGAAVMALIRVLLGAPFAILGGF